MIRRSSGQRQEYVSTLILFYVLARRNKVQEQQKSGKANLKTLRCIHHIKMQWESMEKQLDSSGKKPRFFNIVHSSRDPERLDTEEHPTEGTESSSCQCSTTSCGNQMIGIASQTERMSRITRSSSFQDSGRFLVRAQGRHGTEVLTINRDSAISSEIRWYNNSKKQDTLFPWAPVLWIEEFWNEDKTKVPFTSVENPRTRNSFFRRCILQLSSVSTEQRRTGVLSSAWRMKRKDQMQFLWTVKCWLLGSQQKWKGSPQTQAPGNREQGHTSFRVLENRVQMTQLCEKASFQYLFSAGKYYQIQLDGKDGWREITFFMLWIHNFTSFQRIRSQVSSLCRNNDWTC